MEAAIEAFFSHIAANIDKVNSAQAIFQIIGIALLVCIPSLLKVSRTFTAAAAILGLGLSIAPVVLPSPVLAVSSTKPSDFVGVWRIVEDQGFMFDWSVSKLDDDGTINGSISIISCPIKKPCDPCNFKMSGRYYKESGSIKFVRFANCGVPDHIHTASFKSDVFATGSFYNGDANYWFTLARVQ